MNNNLQLELQQLVTSTTERTKNENMPTSNGSEASSSCSSNRVHHTINEINLSELETLEEIGQGTTSRVHLALYNDSLVAVKKLRPASEIEDLKTRQFVESDFENELVINMQIMHKYIIQLIGYTLNNKLNSLVFESCHEGKVLNCTDDYYTLAQSLEIGIQIANALSYVHSLGIIHRDLKPSQIIIMKGEGKDKDGDGLFCKLGDWGLATATNFKSIRSPSIVGTLEFVSYCNVSSSHFSLFIGFSNYWISFVCV